MGGWVGGWVGGDVPVYHMTITAHQKLQTTSDIAHIYCSGVGGWVGG